MGELKDRQRRSGQALVMVTLALFAMCGMMGLAVDLGWSYYVRKAERAATDSAALSAVRYALLSGCFGSGSCATVTNVSCNPAPGDAALAAGCQYAKNNGYFPGGNSGRQAVSVSSGNNPPTPIPTVTGINTTPLYWVTVTASDSVPQLFSAVTGHPLATVANRSTAIIASLAVPGSIITLNRKNDPAGEDGAGTNFCIANIVKPTEPPPGWACNSGAAVGKGGNGNGFTVQADGGITIDSSAASGGFLDSKGNVTGGPTQIFQGSSSSIGGATQNWKSPITDVSGGPQFNDPEQGKGQPPITSTKLGNAGPNVGGGFPSAVSGGTAANPRILAPGNYWVQDPLCGANCIRSNSAPLTLNGGYFKFTDPNGSNNFGDYFFYGGLNITNGAIVEFGPGRYVFAGTTSINTPSLQVDTFSSVALVDRTSDPSIPASNAGELFIYTNLNYPGLANQIPSAVSACACQFNYAQTGITDGLPQNNGKNALVIDLHGLNSTDPNLPSDLKNFAPFVMWQDQGNSLIKYDANGNVDTSCGGINTPCLNNTLANAESPEMNLLLGNTPGGSGKYGNGLQLEGAIYQPRGSWLDVFGYGLGSSSTVENLQLITGSILFDGAGNPLEFAVPKQTATMLIPALVE